MAQVHILVIFQLFIGDDFPTVAGSGQPLTHIIYIKLSSTLNLTTKKLRRDFKRKQCNAWSGSSRLSNVSPDDHLQSFLRQIYRSLWLQIKSEAQPLNVIFENLRKCVLFEKSSN